MAAAKPAMSPMTPPPNVISVEARSAFARDERVVDARDGLQLLEALAVGDQDRLRCAADARASCAPCSRQTSGLETTKRRSGARGVVEQRAEAVDARRRRW